MNAKHGFLIAFAITIGEIAYFDITKCKKLPWPPRFIAAGVAFMLMDLFSLLDQDLANMMAIGTVLAALVGKGFVSSCNNSTSGVQTDAASLGSNQPISYEAFSGGNGGGATGNIVQ